MNCQECESLFDDMLDKRVKEPFRRQMELHLSRCADCHAKLEERKRRHKLLFRALNNAECAMHLPGNFADRLVAECRAPQSWWQNFAVPRWAMIAATLAIMAGFVFAATVAIEAVANGNGGTEGTEATYGTQGTEDTSQDVASANTSTEFSEKQIANLATSVSLVSSVSSVSSVLSSNNQGEPAMNRKKAAAAALMAATAAVPIMAASGDEYQFIDPTTYPAANLSHSAKSAAIELDSGARRVAGTSGDLEARSRSRGVSLATAINASKLRVFFISVK